MNTLLSYSMFEKMRDNGQFSTKFQGKHSYFLYLEVEEKKELEVYVRDEYQSPPPAPRYRNNSVIHKYLGSDNVPNKYHVNIN
jgi:hypothetical protein